MNEAFIGDTDTISDSDLVSGFHSVALATMSMGPVQFGDDLDEMSTSDWKILQKCCSSDGTILRPDQPLGYHDVQLSSGDALFNDPARVNYQTYSSVELINVPEREVLYQNIFLHKDTVTSDYESESLKGRPNVVFKPFLGECEWNIEKVHLEPAFELKMTFATTSWSTKQGQIAFFGDLSKIVPLSSDRIKSVEYVESKQLIRVNVVNSRSNLYDEVTLGFCHQGRGFLSGQFALQQWSEESASSSYTYDLVTGQILSENTECQKCKCDQSCGTECWVYETTVQTNCEGDKPLPDYRKCTFNEAQSEWCLSDESFECIEDGYFEEKECGICIHGPQCLGCKKFDPTSLGKVRIKVKLETLCR